MKKTKIIIAILLLPIVIPFLIGVLSVIILFIVAKLESFKGIPPEDLPAAAVETATAYIEEKYGDALTYCNVEEGRTSILGGKKYWDVFFKDKKGMSESLFTVRVFHDSENKDSMYIEYETYYSFYIKDKMYSWLNTKLLESSLSEYSLEYVGLHDFSPGWSTDYTVEEILEHFTDEKGYILFYLRIPERERNNYDSGQLVKELSELSPYLGNGFNIALIIYSDDVYDSNLENFNSGNREYYIPEIEHIYIDGVK